MTDIDTVIYDLGGVLLDWQPAVLFEPLLPTGTDVERFLAQTQLYHWNNEHDRGVDWEVAVAAVARNYPQHAGAFAQYPRLFGDSLVGTVPGSMELLEEVLATDVQVLGLTNFARDNFEIARADYPWLDLFDGVVVSGHERVVKPDPRIYRVLIQRYAVVPERAVFIDDRAENVQAARDLGFQGIDFVDSAELRRSLIALGVLGRTDQRGPAGTST
ncbi:MAG: HAD family phosphatase [Candidatus Nanopelagicales bacterium]|nr:HAD family phosphatase [Candidatus Nanopelagicales bacterium]